MKNQMTPLIIFDLETTGVSVTNDRIVQIACIKIENDEITAEKKTLINPTISISPGATEVHGITNEDVRDAPTFAQISKSLFEFIQGCDIGGYNSNRFDVPMLQEEFYRAGIEWNPDKSTLYDFFQMESALYSRKLTDAYKRYTGKDLDDAHDAMADVMATYEVMKGQMSKSGLALNQFPEFYADPEKKLLDFGGRFYEKDGVVYFNFGKHQDRPASEHVDYLMWMQRQDFGRDTLKVISDIIS